MGAYWRRGGEGGVVLTTLEATLSNSFYFINSDIEYRMARNFCGLKFLPLTKRYVACVAWRFWLGELSNKGGRGQRNREEIGAGAGASPLVLARFAREFFVATPLLRPARQNRHATQAKRYAKVSSRK